MQLVTLGDQTRNDVVLKVVFQQSATYIKSIRKNNCICAMVKLEEELKYIIKLFHTS